MISCVKRINTHLNFCRNLKKGISLLLLLENESWAGRAENAIPISARTHVDENPANPPGLNNNPCNTLNVAIVYQYSTGKVKQTLKREPVQNLIMVNDWELEFSNQPFH